MGGRVKNASGGFVIGLVGVIFLIVGTVLLAAGIVWLSHVRRFTANADVIDAVITDIERYRESDGDWHSRVYVSYEYRGNSYRDVPISQYSSMMRVGKELKLYIDPDSPYDVSYTKLTYLGPGLFAGLGALFAVVGGVLCAGGIVRSGKKRKLRENGRLIYAEVTGGYLNTAYSAGGRSPYVLECRYIDEYSGQTYLYADKYCWQDPQMFIGQQVPVYVDPNDMSKYVVDSERLAQQANVVDYR